MPREKQPKIPKYSQSYPDHLATDEQLKALDLKPGGVKPAALLEYVCGDVHGICGLYERAEAVPVVPRSETLMVGFEMPN